MAMCKASSPLGSSHNTHETGRRPSGEVHWVPNTDVFITDGGIVIKAELAGLNREELALMVEGNRLKISGHRSDGCRKDCCKFQLMEIHYGAFESVIELPEGYDLSRAKAAYQNGFLRVDVPVAEPATTKPAKRRSSTLTPAH